MIIFYLNLFILIINLTYNKKYIIYKIYQHLENDYEFAYYYRKYKIVNE